MLKGVLNAVPPGLDPGDAMLAVLPSRCPGSSLALDGVLECWSDG